MRMIERPIAVIGAGSWGTALGIHLAQNHSAVHLWDIDSVQIEKMQKNRVNDRYLPGIPFPSHLKIYRHLAEAITEVSDILLVVPSQVFRETLQTLKPLIPKVSRLIWATKGLDPAFCVLLSEVVKQEIGTISMAVLSGPSFAGEVAEGLPTAVVVASNDESLAQDVVAHFNHHAFRVYTSSDLVGVQLGGAVKNVIALAAGASDGLHFGANAKSGLITRGLAEIVRLGLAMGAELNTFMGLAGLGDLVLTCTDNQSRNRRFGLAIAQGLSFEEAEQSIGQVVEGVHTVRQVIALSHRYHVEMPICEQVLRVLQGEVTPKEAVTALLSRAPKSEF